MSKRVQDENVLLLEQQKEARERLRRLPSLSDGTGLGISATAIESIAYLSLFQLNIRHLKGESKAHPRVAALYGCADKTTPSLNRRVICQVLL